MSTYLVAIYNCEYDENEIYDVEENEVRHALYSAVHKHLELQKNCFRLDDVEVEEVLASLLGLGYDEMVSTLRGHGLHNSYPVKK